MSQNSFSLYYKATVHLLKLYALGLIMLMLFRTALLLSFGNLSELHDYKLDLLNAFWTGFRFDTNVLAYGFLPLFVLNPAVLLISRRAQDHYGALNRFSTWFSVSVFFVFLCTSVTDFFYFMFFQSHFNKLLFGIAAGETIAVLTSVWTDYPVVSILLFVAVVMVAVTYTVKRIFGSERHIGETSLQFRMAFMISFTGLYLLALHGSIGLAPISKEEDTVISSDLFLNDLTLNGVFALKEAFSEKGRGTIAPGPATFRRANFPGKQNITGGYAGGALNENRKPHDQLYAKTPSNPFLQKEPPHVIFVLMESMSNYYLDLHSPSLNLLGSLEKQLPACIVLRNFLPAGNGTTQSLEALLVNGPSTSLAEAQSSYIDKSFSSSVALPFLNAGYHTSFITGGNLRFLNLDKFVPRQYFLTVEGSETLLSEVRGSEAGTWGVHDEFLFKRVFSKLERSNGKPQFIFAMTVSNHTPFDIPKKYEPSPLHIPSDLLKKIKTGEKIALKNFTAYQYMNDSLGRFLERLRNSPYGENTIVAATGDHNTLQLFHFPYTQLLQKLSVPLIMYIPKRYLPAAPVDATHFASHKDIFPTLFHLSLSEATYLKTGVNLLDGSIPATKFFALNDDNVSMNRDGCILMRDKPLFYKWQDNRHTGLRPTTARKSPGLGILLKESIDAVAAMDSSIQAELSK
jgi:hypothetical protein